MALTETPAPEGVETEDRPRPPTNLCVQFTDYIQESATYYKKHPGAVKSEILSGITISILKVPESVAFSYVAGVHPLQGLYGSFFMGIITGFLGGRPGMISGCAGALAVVIKDIMDDDGPFPDECPEKRREYLFFTMVLTGFLQLVCGLCRCAVLVRLIPKTAFLGFFNGLAVVIFMSQLQTFKKSGGSQATAVAGCGTVDYGFKKDQEWYKLDERTTWLMLVHVFVVMAMMELLPMIPAIPLGAKPEEGAKDNRFKLEVARILPPSLVGLLLTMAIEWGIFRPNNWDTPIVKDVSRIEGQLPPWHIPDVPWDEWDTWWKCLPTAASLCAIGLVESVLTLQAVDQILDQTTEVPAKNQECLAQGLANLTSGFFKAMGGDAMIGQSTINVLNGAQGRLSAITDATFLMIYVVSLSPFIESVPTAGLAGVLFIVVIHTFNWPSIAIILRRALPLYMCATIIIVTVLSVLTNLALGIGVGILWECVFYVWNEGDELNVRALKGLKQKTYQVAGNVFFANADNFNGFFTPSKDPDSVVCDLANARLLDYSALFTLNALGRRYELVGKEFKVEMKPDDFERYMAVSDEDLRRRGGIARFLQTKACKSIQGKVFERGLEEWKFQEFLFDGSGDGPGPQPTVKEDKSGQSGSGQLRIASKERSGRVSERSNGSGNGTLVRRPSKNVWRPGKSDFEHGFAPNDIPERSRSKEPLSEVSAYEATRESPAGKDSPLTVESVGSADLAETRPSQQEAGSQPASWATSRLAAAGEAPALQPVDADKPTPPRQVADPSLAIHPLGVPTPLEEVGESDDVYELEELPPGLEPHPSEEWV